MAGGPSRAGLICVVLLAVAGAPDSRADEPLPVVEAAELAFATHQSHCPDLAAGDTGVAAEALVEVGEVWAEVDRTYAMDPEPFLLYWRGVLAQCLGQETRAVDDLRGFYRTHRDDADLANLSKDARRRLALLGVRVRPPRPPRNRHEGPGGWDLDRTVLRFAGGTHWLAYHLEAVGLGLFDLGHMVSVLPLPWLSVDLQVRMAAYAGTESVDGQDHEVLRTIPWFAVGTSARGEGRRVSPFVGFDLYTNVYALAVQEEGRTRPLFGVGIALRGGVEFRFDPVIGVYVRGRLGFAYEGLIQDVVGSEWSPVSPVLSVGTGLCVRLPGRAR